MRVWLLKMSAAKSSAITPSSCSWSGVDDGGEIPPIPFVRRRYGAIDFEYVIWSILLFHRTSRGGKGGRLAFLCRQGRFDLHRHRPSSLVTVEGGWGEKTRVIRFCHYYNYIPKPAPPPPPSPPPLPPSSSWRVIEYFFAGRDWFVVPVAGRTNESGGDGGCWGRVVGGGCSHLSSKRIAMVTRPRRHRLKGLRSTRGWRPGLVGVPAGLILNFKEVPAAGKDTCNRRGGICKKNLYWFLSVSQILLFEDVLCLPVKIVLICRRKDPSIISSEIKSIFSFFEMAKMIRVIGISKKNLDWALPVSGILLFEGILC